MDEVFSRFVSDLVGRLSGPLTLRLFLQPAVAGFFAARDGLKDARLGRSPYFWGLFTEPQAVRRRRLRDGWRSVMKVFIMAIALDIVYEVIVFRKLYPGESLVVAIVLALVPYVLLRGLVTRLARPWLHPAHKTVR